MSWRPNGVPYRVLGSRNVSWIWAFVLADGWEMRDDEGVSFPLSCRVGMWPDIRERCVYTLRKHHVITGEGGTTMVTGHRSPHPFDRSLRTPDNLGEAPVANKELLAARKGGVGGEDPVCVKTIAIVHAWAVN